MQWKAVPTTEKPPVPREHGAWGILLVPFATAVGVAGVWNLPVALLLASVLCFYLARASWLKRQWRWLALLLAASVAAAAPLLLIWHRGGLLVFAAVAGLLAGRPTGRTVASQLLGVAGLTLTAPAAWYVATGELAWRLWLLNGIYFAGGVFYVRMHLQAAIHRLELTDWAARFACGRANLLYHAGAAVAVLGMAAAGIIAWPVPLAFAPMVARALAGTMRLSPTLRIKRLGWTEVAYSIGFAIVLVGAFRFG